MPYLRPSPRSHRVAGAVSLTLAALAAGCGESGTVPAVDGGGLRDAAPEPLDTPAPDAPPPPGCGDGRVDPGEACDDGNASRFDGCLPDCTEPIVLGPPPGAWTYYEVPGTQCIDGSPAGIGVSLVAGSPDLMIYLEGGGGCFNDACDLTALSIPFVPPPDGIFNRSMTANPVRDFSMVYVPYCTGDIHAGDRDTMLAGAVRHFRGYSNFTRFLEAIVPAFPDVTRVLVTGISAGGFGAGLNAEQAALAFPPSTQIVLVDDSGPPFGNEVIPPCLQRIFREVWGLDDTVLRACGADCPDPDDFASGFIRHLDRRYPGMRVGLFSNVADAVIREFMGFGWCGGVHDDCDGVPFIVPASVYEDGLLSLRTELGDRASFFFVGRLSVGLGLGHTTLRSPSFYVTSVGGVSVPEWLGDVLDGRVVQVGP